MSFKIYDSIVRNGGRTPFGQKLNTTITVGAVINIGSIIYRSWRDTIVRSAVCDMILNYIGPGFQIGNNWTLIENTSEDMMEGDLYIKRIRRSDRRKRLLMEYKKIYKLSADMTDVDMDPGDIENYRNSLHKDMLDIYGKLLSRVTLVNVHEHLFTLGTITKTVKTAFVVPPQYHSFLTDINMFNKYIFDILYSCHILHKRLGVINSNLHLDNTAIIRVVGFYNSVISPEGLKDFRYNKDKKYCTLYKVGETKFYFPFDGWYSAIIDFSDSFIGEKFLEYIRKFLEKTETLEQITELDFPDILNKLENLIPIDRKRVNEFLEVHYSKMFKVLTTMDYVTLLKQLRITFEKELQQEKNKEDRRIFYVDSKIMERLKYMEERSLKYLSDNLQKVLDDSESKIEFPGDTLLSEFFEDYIKSSSDTEIWEAWNFNAEHKYSSSDYPYYPPWAQKDEVIKKFGKKEADEFFKGNYISDEIGSSGTRLEFLDATANLESELNINYLL